MNGLLKTLGAVALFAMVVPAAAGAQQTSLLPAGITVVGTGTATVAEWVQAASFIAASGSANASPVAVARVEVPPASIAHFIAGVTKSGWKASARLVPRDLAAAKDSAYKAAYADAHARAASIAAADGHHLGRLLNVTPALGDYVGSMMSSVASIFDMLGKGSMLTGGVPELTQSATFTFEITP